MEPERQIEKLLRAIAKKRRADAGDSFELHPATRRLLQGEVTRRKPTLDEPGVWGTILAILWRRMGFILCALAIVFVGTMMLVPALSIAKMRAQRAHTISNLYQIGMAIRMFANDNGGRTPVSLAQITDYLGRSAADAMIVDSDSKQRFVYVGGATSLNSLPADSVLAYSPVDKRGRFVLFADGHVEKVNSAKFASLTNRGLLQLASAKASRLEGLREVNEPAPATRSTAVAPATAALAAPATAAPVAAPATLASLDDREGKEQVAGQGARTHASGELKSDAFQVNAGSVVFQNRTAAKASPPADALSRTSPASSAVVATNAVGGDLDSYASQRFARADAVSNLPTKDKAAGSGVAVLANFQVEQRGNEIRIVDEDGSVYRGNVQAEVATAEERPVAARKALAPSESVPAEIQAKNARDNMAANISVQNYSFRVAGTNRSLNQRVVFYGNVANFTNATPLGLLQNNAAGNGVPQQLQPAAMPAALLQNSCINGNAVIDDRKQIEINAVPVAR